MGRTQRTLTGALLALCGLLGACGHSHGDAVRQHASQGSEAGSGPSDLVSAVSGAGTEEGPVGLKFQMGERPVAGRPTVMMLRLVANEPLEHLEARFRPDEGLDVTQGGEFDPEGHMDPGTAVDHTLTLVPARDGIYTVMATVTTGLAAEAVSRSFVIPIVVGTSAASLNVGNGLSR